MPTPRINSDGVSVIASRDIDKNIARVNSEGISVIAKNTSAVKVRISRVNSIGVLILAKRII